MWPLDVALFVFGLQTFSTDYFVIFTILITLSYFIITGVSKQTVSVQSVLYWLSGRFLCFSNHLFDSPVSDN
jgi:hypothetical protein